MAMKKSTSRSSGSSPSEAFHAISGNSQDIQSLIAGLHDNQQSDDPQSSDPEEVEITTVTTVIKRRSKKKSKSLIQTDKSEKLQTTNRRYQDVLEKLKHERDSLKKSIQHKSSTHESGIAQLKHEIELLEAELSQSQHRQAKTSQHTQTQQLRDQLQKQISQEKISVQRQLEEAKIQEQRNRVLIQQLQSAGYDAVSSSSAQDVKEKDKRIAVVGYSCILPGCGNVNEAWDMISNKIDNIVDLPDSRVDVTAYYHPDQKTKDKIYCTRGGFIPDFEIIPREYNLNMHQLEDVDANQTLTLLKVKEAMQDAGIDSSNKNKKNIGVVLGIGGGQKSSQELYSRLNYVVVEKVLRKMGLPEEEVQEAAAKFKANFPEWRLDSFPGFLGNVTAGRVSNVFNLDGMNCVVDAACASSLVAVKLAIDELLYGNCSTMICGATCTDCSIGMFMAFSKTPVFSRKQSVTAYDKDTGGMLIGEGSVVFLLKKLSDAIADGDRVHAVIRGVGASSDGKAPGIYAPTISGQELAIRRAYKDAGVDPSTITYVEGHGTGTPVGDVIELTALSNVMGQSDGDDKATQRVAVGSIKSNIGHLKACAGMAGLLKAILALKHKILPATINVVEPPKLRDGRLVSESSLYINSRERPWFTKGELPRRAGVSSFGFGGANYHCVLEEFESEHKSAYRGRTHQLPYPVLFSAAQPDQLIAIAEQQQRVIHEVLHPKNGEPSQKAITKAFVAFCLEFCLKNAPPTKHARFGFVASDPTQTMKTLAAAVRTLQRLKQKDNWDLPKEGVYYRRRGIVGGVKGKVAAIFSGQGSQYTRMFEKVAINWPPFRESVVMMNRAMAKVDPKNPSASDVLYPREPYSSEPPIDESVIRNTLFAQPTTVASSLACFDIFSHAGFSPDFVSGHSLGELTALHIGGAFDRDVLCELVCHRAVAMSNISGDAGTMAAIVGKGASNISLMTSNVWKANENSPAQLVISGGKSEIAQESERLSKMGFKVTPLKVSGAFHTPFMQKAADKFATQIHTFTNMFKVRSGTLPRIFSNVTGKEYPTQPSQVINQLSSHITSPVHFVDQIHAMYNAGARIFVEFGPRRTLSKLIDSILSDKKDVTVIPVNPLAKKRCSDLQLRSAAAQLAVCGVALSNFDPWDVPNPFLLGRKFTLDQLKSKAVKKRGAVKLSAATFISRRTLKKRDEIMNNGFKVSGTVVAEQKNNPAFSKMKIALQESQQQLHAAQEELKKIKKEAQLAKRNLANLKRDQNKAVKINKVPHQQTKVHQKNKTNKVIHQQTNGTNKVIHQQTKVHQSNGLPLKIKTPTVRFTESSKNPSPPDKFMKFNAKDPSFQFHKMTWHPLAGKDGNPTPEFFTTNYPARPVCFLPFPNNPNDKIFKKATLPFNWYHLSQFTCGDTSFNFPEFTRFEGTITSRCPGFDLQLVTRVISIDDTEEGEFYGVDLNPAKGTMIGEFDCPADAWFFKGNSNDSLMPYSILMEICLQLSGVLTAWLKAPLTLNKKNCLFRNLDASAELFREVDVRGKTIVNTTRCVGFSMLGQMAIHRFICELAVDGEKFYTAETSFGWFIPEVFLKQVGLDNGKKRDPWHIDSKNGNNKFTRFVLPQDENKLFASTRGQLRRRSTQTKYIDSLVMVADVGGEFGKGYSYGGKVVDKKDWFFSCHFWCDPVMPGSLGIEAMFQCIEAYCVFTKLGAKFQNPIFAHVPGKTSWKYRGQLTPNNNQLDVETHIKSISTNDKGQIIICADGYIGVDKLRVYRARDLRVCIKEGDTTSHLSIAQNSTFVSSVSASASTTAPDATRVVLEVLADKTGYDTDMIDFEMELETELGIDSIKRVEILSAVQAQLGVEAKDVEALSRTRTVGEVVEAMKKELSSENLSSENVATSTEMPQSNTSRPSIDATHVVLEVLADKTGYDTDMIDFEMELETELGIDSIKRVEILSAVQSQLGVEAKDVEALSRTRTVGDVVNAMQKELSSHDTSLVTHQSITDISDVQETSELSVNATHVVLEVLADKTGYDTDMIDFEMELETELGIDSIKRVEILSAVQSQLGVEAKDVEALSRTRTVGDVIEAMQKELSVSSKSVTHPSTSVTPIVHHVSGSSSTDATRVVLEVLADKTGYDTDMIDFEMELETELGIDSIKRVEILSAVQSQLDVEAKDVEALSRTRTVGDVIKAMQKELSVSSTGVAATAVPVDKSQQITSAPSIDATRVVLEVLADKTGYDTDMIDFEMELETELGIDSIKRVEILSAVQSQLDVEAKDVEALSRTRTVGDVIEAMQKELSSGRKEMSHVQPSTESKSVSVSKITNIPEKSTSFVDVDVIDATNAAPDVSLAYASVMEIPEPNVLLLETPADRPIILVDTGTNLTLTIAKRLAVARPVVLLSFSSRGSSLPSNCHRIVCDGRSEDSLKIALSSITRRYGVPGGFIYQHDEKVRDAASQLKWCLLAAKHLSPSLKQSIEKGRTFFIALTHIDGRLGITDGQRSNNLSNLSIPEIMSVQQGAVFGLCKTLALEWAQDHVFCRGIDLDPSLSDDSAALYVEQELVCSNITLREVSYTANGHRYTSTTRHLTNVTEFKSHRADFTAEDAVIVTGGARGITPLCVAALASRIGGGIFFLLGRSKMMPEPVWANGVSDGELGKTALKELKRLFKEKKGSKPTPRAHKSLVAKVLGSREIRQSLKNIEQNGGRAVYVVCDVSSVADIAKAMAEIRSKHKVARITGIIHAAGVLRDRLVENKPPSDFELVYGIKVSGLNNLLCALDKVELNQLRHLVVFSSLAGFHGNSGQSDYSMANDALSKIAHRFASTHLQCRVRSLCFGPWDGGMVTPILKAHFKSMGVQIIPRSGGALQVAALLSLKGSGRCQCLIGNWGLPPVAPRDDRQIVQFVVHPPTSSKNNFFLSHMIHDRPVLPMTIACGHIAVIVARLHPGWFVSGIEKCKLFKGLIVDQAINCQLEIVRKNVPDKNKDLRVYVTMKAKFHGRFLPSYKAIVVLCRSQPASPRFENVSLLEDPTSMTKKEVYNGITLFHGPSLQSIHRVLSVNKLGLVAKCTDIPLSFTEKGQFSNNRCCSPVMSFAADVSYQAMLIWARVIHAQAALPNSANSFEFFSAIPSGESYFVTLQMDEGTGATRTGTVYFHDKSGVVYCQASGLSVTMNKTLSFTLSKSSKINKSNVDSNDGSRKDISHLPQSQPMQIPITGHHSDQSINDLQDDQRIAVVGMAVKYAGASNTEEFWDLMMKEGKGTGTISSERLSINRKDLHISQKRSKYADNFINETYGVLQDVKNEHDLLLDLARVALNDANQRKANGTLKGLDRCGIVSGCLSFPRDEVQHELMPIYTRHMEKYLKSEMNHSARGRDGTWGTFKNISKTDKNKSSRARLDPASYVAKELGLLGGCPRYCIDAACATALYTLKLAQNHLVRKEADVILCGGSCLPEPFFILTGFSAFQALPFPNQRSLPFDSETAGLTPSEGGAIMVLKRYADAVRDGDHIHGVLLGVGVSNSGQGLPLKPHEPSELKCLQDTYQSLDVKPSTVQYVECHATGTPQGDFCEVGAVRNCFSSEHMPLIGSTKGTFGHSLVAAGFAGMCKLLLSMQNNVIPATIGKGKSIDPYVCKEKKQWPTVRDNHPKRGGLSAFGFGGTNAHAVFEEYNSKKSMHKVQPPALNSSQLAIIGMACHFGTLSNLSQLEQAMYHGGHGACIMPPKRWRFLSNDPDFRSLLFGKSDKDVHGCFVESVDVDYRRLKLPLLKEDELIPQQLIAISIIDKALLDSASLLQKGVDTNVAVLVGLGTHTELYRHRARCALRERLGIDAEHKRTKEEKSLLDYMSEAGTSTSYTSNIGNIIATRIASMWGFTGPAFTITEGSNSVYRCMQLAKGMLATSQVDAVVVAGVDLCGSAEALYSKVRHGGVSISGSQYPHASFEQSADGFFIGEGSGALVLKRLDDCDLNQDKARVYATVDAIVEKDQVTTSAKSALKQAGLSSKQVDLLELSGDNPSFDIKELEGLSEAYSYNSSNHRNIAITTSKAIVGHCGYASGVAALIQTALCLYNRYIPTLPRWTAPKENHRHIWEKSNFYTSSNSRAWVKNKGFRRYAGVSGLSDTNPNSCFHLIMSDVAKSHETKNLISIKPDSYKLVTMRAKNVPDLTTAIETSLNRLKHSSDAEEMNKLLTSTVSTEGTENTPFCLCLVTTAKKLQKELKFALKGLHRSAKTGSDWFSPSGSFFTHKPLHSNRVAFVYGDGAAPYLGLGRDLHRIIPMIHEHVDAKTTNLWGVEGEEDVPWDEKVFDHRQNRPKMEFGQVDMFRSGVYHAFCFTHLAREYLGLQPKASFGFSMGEVSMLFAFSNNNSHNANEMINRLKSSSVWMKDLAVEFNALRSAWGFSQEAPVSSFWQGYAVQASRNKVEQIMKKYPEVSKRVRLILVNDTQHVIIAGVPKSCLMLIDKLGVQYTVVDQSMTAHCKEVVPYAAAIARIHDFLVLPQETGIQFFTSVGNKPLVKNTNAAQLVSKLYSQLADFPQSVETVHREGYDVFVELGAQDMRSHSIDDILSNAEKKHLSVAIDRKGSNFWHHLLKSAARLISHGVPNVQISRLYHPNALTPISVKHRLQRNIVINGYFEDIRKIQETQGTYSSSLLEDEINYQRKRQKEYKGPLLWNFDDLLQYAEGEIAPVFNKYLSGVHEPWEVIDQYKRRVRLPQREYLLCSRVTKMEATTNVFQPCTMSTEYDIPYNSELSEGGDVPWAVLVESGQCDLMLISYLGIDFQCKSNRVYRLLDTTLTFFGVAHEGQTLCYDIKINSYAKKNGQIAMFFFQYNCYVDGKLLIEMRNGVAGFFTDEELAAGKGVLYTKEELKTRKELVKKDISKVIPFLTDITKNKTDFSETDMLYLCTHGQTMGWGKVMPHADEVYYKLCARKMLMINRITHVIPNGGAYGLGLIIGEKDLERDHWYFPCHFKDDEVMAGSLVSDGCSQMLKFYMVWLGLHKAVNELTFRPVNGQPNKVRCRGQISPHRGKLVYAMEVTDLGFDKKTGFPYAKSDVNIIDVNYELGETFDFNKLDLYGRDIPGKKIVVDFKGVALQIEGTASDIHPILGSQSLPQPLKNKTSKNDIICDHLDQLANSLMQVEKRCIVSSEVNGGKGSIVVPRIIPADLGSQSFMTFYGVKYPLYTGAMAKGIASADLVVACGKSGVLASFGSGGLPLSVTEKALDQIQEALPNGPYAVNLIHSPFDDFLERDNMEMLLRRGVHVVEASAFTKLTPHLVRYRVSGLVRHNGGVQCTNKLIFKLSRTELAEMAMLPPPPQMVARLLKEGKITADQAEMAKLVAMSDDVAVESDSGGHTDNRPFHVIFPLIVEVRNRLQAEGKLRQRIRIGLGGGIGCPEAVQAAFAMGAAFVLTGSVNQMSRQSGSSDPVRKKLSEAAYSDVTMAPAADMFDEGVKLQVLKKGSMFPARAKKLYEYFCTYDSLDNIPKKEYAKLERTIFQKSVAEVWEETKDFYINRLKDTKKIERAERDPKLKMSLCFRWYLGLSSVWARMGLKERSLDYQVWCGPAIGAFNDFISKSILDPRVAKQYPCVVQINLHLLRGCCYLQRVEQLRIFSRTLSPILRKELEQLPHYHPKVFL